LRRLRWRPGKLAKTSLRVMFWQGVRLLCLAGWVVVAARTLGAQDYGLFSGVVGIASALAGLVGLGSGMLMYQYSVRDRRLFPRYWKQTLVMCAATSLPLALGFFLFAAHRDALPTLTITLVAMSEIIAYPLVTNAVFAFSANERLGWSAALPAVSAGLRLLAIALFSTLPITRDLTHYLGLHLIASVVGAGFALLSARMLLGPASAHVDIDTSDLRHGVGHAASWTTATSVTTLDKSFVLHAGGDATAGLYAATYRICAVLAMPLDAIVMSALPRLFRGDHQAGHHRHLIAGMATAAIGYSLFAALALWLGAPLLPRLLGHDFAAATPALRWMGAFVLAYSLRQMACNALVGRGMKLRKTFIEGCGIVLMSLLSAWLVPRHGVMGATWMIIAAEASMAVAAWIALQLSATGGTLRAGRESNISS